MSTKDYRRKPIRLKGYDYSQAGLYFVTICCSDKVCRFGQIENNQMWLNEYGQIAKQQWLNLPKRFVNLELDIFQLMPNHLHDIIYLLDTEKPDSTVADIIGAYKSLVTNQCLSIYKSKNEIMGKFWQRSYYEHIIRNEKSYGAIAEYIADNPRRWVEDKYYTK